ncbi:hypothetical protein ACS0TY_036442 [Phlomoides rotata]
MDPMEKKPSSFSFFFKRLNKKVVGGRSKSKSSTGFRWKRKFNFRSWLVDTLLFKIASIFEAAVLVSKLCFFFLCCGCRL